MCVNVLPACTYIHHMYAWCLWKLEEGIGPVGLEVLVVVSHHVGPGH